MMKIWTQAIMVFCLIGLFVSTAEAQQQALKVGDKAPDFEVDTLAGEKFKLSARYATGKPTVLLFSRANW